MSDQIDLTIVIVAEPGPLREVCLRGVKRQQQCRPERVNVVSPAEYPAALAEVHTRWVAVIQDGCELAPDWCMTVEPHLSAAEGCVGGVVVRIVGPDTSSWWVENHEHLARMSIVGRPHSHLEDLPTSHRLEPVEFLSPANLVTRTEIAKRAAALGVEATRADYGMAACFLARRIGLRVVYDSALRSALQLSETNRSGGSDDHDWFQAGRQRILALSLYPNRVRGALMICASILVGSRESWGLVLGLACLSDSRRRRRWTETLMGKASALATVRRSIRA